MAYLCWSLLSAVSEEVCHPLRVWKEMEPDICLNEYCISFPCSQRLNYWRECTFKNRSVEDTADYSLLAHSLYCGVKERPLHELKRWKAWWNSSLPAIAQADSSACRSNRWPWSLVARKLVIKYFNSDWFRNLRFIKRRVKSFVIQMARCLIWLYGW